MYKLLAPIAPLTEITVVQRLSDMACIPFDLDNTDYQAYLKWVEEGNEPLPAENE
jgi:hypothetical protein